MKIRANSRADLEALVYAIRNIPTEDRCQLAAVIVNLGLMNSPDKIEQAVVRVLKEGGGLRALVDFFKFTSVVDPNSMEQFIEGTVDHILNGADTEDDDSVGGWSQREIDLLLASYKFGPA